MTTDQNDFSIVRFSTDDLPEKDRAAIWREHFGPSVFKVEIEPPPPNTPLKVDMAARSLPGLQLLSGLYAPGRMIRTRRLIADDGNDDFILRINTSGTVIVSAAGRKLDYAFGAVLTNAAEVGAFDRPTFGGSTCIRIPHSILSALVEPRRLRLLLRAGFRDLRRPRDQLFGELSQAKQGRLRWRSLSF
jgi:hypothetical protein